MAKATGAPSRRKKFLGEILVEQGIVTDGDISGAIGDQHKKGGAIGQILIEQGKISEQQLLQALGKQMGMPVVDLDEMDISEDVVSKINVNMATLYKIVPISFDGNVMTVAMADPMNLQTLDELAMMLGCKVQGAVASSDQIAAAMQKYYAGGGGGNEAITDVMGELEQMSDMVPQSTTTHTIDIESIKEISDAQPVRRMVSLVLLQAIKDKASDIHFEPFEDTFKIRYRIDGVLYEMPPPPKSLALALTSRIKVMSNLDISERRLPQDGRIELNVGGMPIDIRVSTLPTMFGESVVMRVLDRSNVSLDLERLGFRSDELAVFRSQIRKPHGIILVTGPTSSGKTTTLYSALNEINDIGDKIITVEDPVEYDLDGIIQVPVDASAGRSFADALRSILRQDPDKILVGEIRDYETAEIAIHASLTGHLVFSTLHTNDAPTTITRLVDLGCESYLVTATVECILAQRLVRMICPHCKTEYRPSEEVLFEMEITPAEAAKHTFHYGKGCETCHDSGYLGRMGIFETMILNDELRERINEGASTSMVRATAMSTGMRTLRQAGLLSVFDGVTTLEEVARATILEQE